jgi:hypothetical protein
MAMAKSKTLTPAALAGMAIGIATPYTAQAQDSAAGKTSGVKCYGINGCGQHASCAVKAADLAAVKALLGDADYKARFGKSTMHSCGAHASCGASSKILNWTTVSETECQQSKGIVIEETNGKKAAKQL